MKKRLLFILVFLQIDCVSSLKSAETVMQFPKETEVAFWQNYYKLIQCTALRRNAPSIFRTYPWDNGDGKDKSADSISEYEV